MPVIENFPGGFVNEKPHFSIGYKTDYEALVAGNIFDSTCFYVVKDVSTGKYYLYLGDKPLTSALDEDVIVDSSLSYTSTNPVQNKIVTDNLNKAVEVIKDDGTIESYTPGKFYYEPGDTISGKTATLKFYISALESIDLSKKVEVVSTYSASSIDAISGKGVAAALETLKIVDVTEEPEIYVAGTLYRVYDQTSGIYTLIYSPKGTSATNINFSQMVPTDHSDTSNKYGSSTDSKYGHAKSGIPYDDSSTVLADAYADSNKDKDLVGSNVDAFARVDHKHPYPSFVKVAATASDSDNLAIAKQLLGEEQYAFIQSGEGASFLKEEDSVVPANIRLNRIEAAYISSTATESQSITSPLTVNNNLTVRDDNILTVKKIATPQVNGEYSDIAVLGGLSTTKGLTVGNGLTVSAGNITAIGQSISAASLSLTGKLTATGAVDLGPNGDGLKIVLPNGSEAGKISSAYDLSVPNLNAVGSVNAGALNGTLSGKIASCDEANFTSKVTTKAFTIEVDSGSSTTNFNLAAPLKMGTYSITSAGNASFGNLTASTFKIGATSLTVETPTSRTQITNPASTQLKVGEAVILTEYDLRSSNGLVYTWITNQGFASASSVTAISNRITSTWNTEDTTKLPTEAAVSAFIATSYVPISSVEGTFSGSNNKIPYSSAVKAYADGLLQNSINTVTNKAATPNAVKTFVEALITVGSSQPTTNLFKGKMWINTSLGNGVIYYYNGSSWVATSAVWS